MNRPTHFHKRHALQIAATLLKHELRAHVVARNEWLQPWAKAATVAATRRLQLSLSPNLAGRFFDAAQIKAPWERHPWGLGKTPASIREACARNHMLRRLCPPPRGEKLCHRRRKGVEPKCEADALCRWERSPRGAESSWRLARPTGVDE